MMYRLIAPVIGLFFALSVLAAFVSGAYTAITEPAQPTAELKAGERSLAVRLELLDDDNTLTDERIEQAVSKVVNQLSAQLGARLRG